MAAPWRIVPRIAAAILLIALPACQPASPAAEPISFESPMGIIRLDGQIEGQGPFTLIWDTGSPGPVIDSRVASRLGLRVREAGEATAAGARPYRVGVARDVTIELGGRRLHYDRVHVLPLTDRLERYAGRPIHGLLGNDLASRFVVEAHYQRRILKLHDADSFRYDGEGVAIPVSVDDWTLARATLHPVGREPIEGRFLVDTGAAEVTALFLNRPFAEESGLVPPAEGAFDEFTAGLSGPVSFRVERLAALEVGGMRIAHPTAAIVRGEAGVLATDRFDGILASGLLSRYRVFFDHARRRIILEPGPRASGPYDFGTTGLLLALEGAAAITVERVAPGSPADRAGLREGDRVLAVDGIEAASVSFESLLERMRTPGVKMSLRVRRNETVVEVDLTPRALDPASGNEGGPGSW
jgi:hypothetical protein